MGINTNIIDQKAEQIVSQEVFCCMSDIMEKLREKDEEFSIRVLEQLPEHVRIHDIFTECQETYDRDELDDYIDKLNEVIRSTPYDTDEDIERLQDLQEALDEAEEAEFEYAEILEYWGVSDWLASKLKEKGELIIEEFNVSIWGRRTSGQHISMDFIMQEIARELMEKIEQM